MQVRRGIRGFGAVAAVAMLGGLMVAGSAGASPESSGGATGRYIVVLHDGVNPDQAANDHERSYGARVDLIYRHALRGYAGTMSAQAAANISRDARVKYVEADQVVEAFAQTTPTGIQRIFADDNTNIDIDATDDKRVDVDVAVIDTGTDSGHEDLNVVGGVDCSGGGPFKQSCSTVSSPTDGNGHGTHVGGTIGAIDNGLGVVGVAPGARLWSVKVLGNNGSGYMSWIIAGIDWVTKNAATIEVANMSLGCECSSAGMDTAIANSVNKGVVYAVAAGNSDKDASTFSPANHPDVITVSALADFDGAPGGLIENTSDYCRDDEDDTLANFSNFGSVVEIAAPGVCIRSTVPGGYATYSGTSMASPHVAGAAALLASKTNPNTVTDTVNIKDTLVNNGNLNWTDDSDGVEERLLDVSSTTVFNPVVVAGSGDGGGDTTTAPATPSGLTAATISSSQIDVSWNAVIDATSYDLERATDSGFSENVVTSSVTSTSKSDTGLAASTTYHYRVRAVNSAGASAWSTDVSATTSAGSSSSGSTAVIHSITYRWYGGKSNNNHVDIAITVWDDAGNAVSGATVVTDIYRDGVRVWENVQATTDSAGTAVYSVKNAQPDCYSTDVENVIAGLNYDDLTDPSDDESCKSDNVTSKGSGGSVNYL